MEFNLFTRFTPCFHIRSSVSWLRIWDLASVQTSNGRWYDKYCSRHRWPRLGFSSHPNCLTCIIIVCFWHAFTGFWECWKFKHYNPIIHPSLHLKYFFIFILLRMLKGRAVDGPYSYSCPQILLKRPKLPNPSLSPSPVVPTEYTNQYRWITNTCTCSSFLEKGYIMSKRVAHLCWSKSRICCLPWFGLVSIYLGRKMFVHVGID